MTVDARINRRLSPVVESAAYFVVAESLTNAAKYARGAAAKVTMFEESGRLVVEIDDNGPGGANPAGQRPERPAKPRRGAGWHPGRREQPGRRDHRARRAAVRVVIAEDQALLREGIVALLREKGIDVVAQAEDGPGLLRILAGHKPDLAIVDVRLPPTFTDEGIRAALEARARYPGLGVLILSQYVEPVYTAELLDSGGEGGIGYLLKERVGDVKAFVAAVESVAGAGRRWTARSSRARAATRPGRTTGRSARSRRENARSSA